MVRREMAIKRQKLWLSDLIKPKICFWRPIVWARRDPAHQKSCKISTTRDFCRSCFPSSYNRVDLVVKMSSKNAKDRGLVYSSICGMDTVKASSIGLALCLPEAESNLPNKPQQRRRLIRGGQKKRREPQSIIFLEQTKRQLAPKMHVPSL